MVALYTLIMINYSCVHKITITVIKLNYIYILACNTGNRDWTLARFGAPFFYFFEALKGIKCLRWGTGAN